MAEIETLEETSLSLLGVKEALENINKRDKTLSSKGTKVLEYIGKITNLKQKDAAELRKKILACGVERLKEKQIVKIIDLMPKDVDSLKIIFSGDNLTLKQEDLKKILECLK